MIHEELHKVNAFMVSQKENIVLEDMESRKPVYLSGLWHFKPDIASERWYRIKVPSFWNTPEQFDHEDNWKQVHEAWYGYSLYLKDKKEDNQDLFLCFEGVALLCDVYVNGQLVGSHGGAFTPFEFNITSYLQFNKINTIALYVRDISHAVDEDIKALNYQVGLMVLDGHVPDPFMPDHPTFGGIWQPVYIEKRPKTRIGKVQIITSTREMRITSKVEINSCDNEEARIEAYVLDDTPEIQLNMPKIDCCLKAGKSNQITMESLWQDPQLWSPENPKLYYFNILLYIGDSLVDRKIIRFGFREIWIEGRHFYLNGKKIRLYGESINKMEQMFCSNHRKDYISLLYKTLKEKLNINCLRLHSMIAPKVMIDAADEIGLLIIDQSAIWSSGGAYYKRGGATFLNNVKKEFEEWIWRDINNPSVIIWDVENEMLRGSHINTWAFELDNYVISIDNTRPVAHSGSGTLMGKSEFYHIHHNEHYYELVKNWLDNPDKPMVIGEWWIGGRAGTPRNITGFDTKRYEEFEEIKAKLYRETIIELRTLGVEGIMPYNFLNYVFRPLFDYRQRICLSPGDNMEACPDFASPYGDATGIGGELVNPGWDKTKPPYRLSNTLADAFYNGFSPVAAFIKNRDKYIQGGSFKKTIVVMNDTISQKELIIKWDFVLEGKTIQNGEFYCKLENCESTEEILNLEAPCRDKDLEAQIIVSVFEGDKDIHRDSLALEIIADTNIKLNRDKISLYDPKGDTQNLFEQLRIPYRLVTIDDIKAGDIDGSLIIGAYSSGSKLIEAKKEIYNYVNSGGRVWVMQQSQPIAWLPVDIGFTSSEVQVPISFSGIVNTSTTRGIYYSHYVPVYAKGHPVFKGIPDLITKWKYDDGRVVDDVYIKPLAFGEESVYNIRVLSGGTKQDHASAMEIFSGKGCYLMTQFKLLENALLDPISKRILCNIISYLSSPELAFVPQKTAILGDETRELIEKLYGVSLPSVDNRSLQEYDNIIIGPEQEWNDGIEQWLYPWLDNGGKAIVLERKPGYINMFGNRFKVLGDSLPTNSIYVHLGNSIVTGLHGTDTELKETNNPVRYPILLDGRTIDSFTLNGKPVIPIVDLVQKDRKAWWYHAPVYAAGMGAVQIYVGNGIVVMWQLDTLSQGSLSSHFARTLFTNIGVQMEIKMKSARDIHVLRAEEIIIDGDIQEWICDLEDTNVTKWKHAYPIVLPAHALYSGVVRDNLDAGGVVYFMHDDENLYVAAQVIDDIISIAEDDKKGDGIAFEIGNTFIRLEIGENEKIIVTKQLKRKNCFEVVDGCISSWKRIGADVFRRNRDIAFIYSGISNPYFGGYAIECAIPWKSIGEVDINQKDCKASVYIIDVDRPYKEEARLIYPMDKESKTRFILE